MKQPKSEPIHLAVISDTHIPDRAPELPQGLLSAIAAAQVDAILHAGDICSQTVLDQLSEIAPVHAVQGNRDWLYGFRLPKTLKLIFNHSELTLTHGHISILQYFLDLVYYGVRGFQFERSYKTLRRAHRDAKIIIYGHTHRQVCTTYQEVTFLNPGSCLPCLYNDFHPQYALMHITAGGAISVDCLSLSAFPL